MRCLPLLLFALTALPCPADVVVIANRTRREVVARITPTVGKPYPLRMKSGQVIPLFNDSPLQISYAATAGVRGSRLHANCAYYFGQGDDGLTLSKIGLHGQGDESFARPLPGSGPTTPAGVINVFVYVDEEETSPDDVWRRRLSKRIQLASDILLAHSGMTLQLTGMGRWESDDATRDFGQTLREFEQEARAPPGGIAIGFSSQYHVQRGRTHMGGTRGPLSSHILLREWSKQIAEHEHLELLVHELGHYLGATHSPELDSVMRPVIGDDVSKLKQFNIRFDPINTLIMSMVGEEVRRRRVKRFSEQSPPTLARLNQIYQTLAQAMPRDTSAPRFAAMTQQGKTVSQAELIGRVVQAITQAAKENQSLPEHKRLTGDDLTEQLVRSAAAEAIAQRGRGAKSLLMGLAIAFDDTATLRSTPGLGDLVRKADPPEMMRERLRMLGGPAMWGRNDLAKHFMISAGLTASLGAPQAHAFGLAKEVLDSNRKSGFSFADLAADRAGVHFAQAVLSGKLTPVALADDFSVVRFMPTIDDLPEGLTAGQFAKEFGSTSDARYRGMIDEIDQRIDRLTGYE